MTSVLLCNIPSDPCFLGKTSRDKSTVVYFNQRTACGAPILWSKYTTFNFITCRNMLIRFNQIKGRDEKRSLQSTEITALGWWLSTTLHFSLVDNNHNAFFFWWWSTDKSATVDVYSTFHNQLYSRKYKNINLKKSLFFLILTF